jgi:hypothetical protein
VEREDKDEIKMTGRSDAEIQTTAVPQSKPEDENEKKNEE